MRFTLTHALAALFLFSQPAFAADQKPKAGEITSRSGGLHGYIGCSAVRPPIPTDYGAGISFYTAVWPLVDEPVANFQIGLAGTWIMPDNADNKDTPLAPPGTYARRWKEREPTFDGVFQTIEGSPGSPARMAWRLSF